MKILVTGIKGQLGFDICKTLTSRGIENIGVDIDDFDITDATATSEFIKNYAPTAVVHCSAFTAVDRAEDDIELCTAVNVTGVTNIAKVCKELGCELMYFSTDYVFPGTGDTQYDVDDEKGPLSVYGKTKYQGELEVTKYVDKNYIVRISWVYGINGNNFIKTMLRVGADKDSLNVVCDQIGSPTYTADVAPVVCDMLTAKKYGTYHMTNEGFCSWAEFAAEIFNMAGFKTAVNPIPTSEYPTRAVRPLNSRLSKESLDRAGLSRLPSWQDALKRYLAELNDAQ